MKKKILIFALFYYPNPVSGAEVAVKEITDRLKHKDYEFHMVTLRGTKKIPNNEQVENIFVHRIFPGANEKPKLEDFSKFPFKYYKYLYQVFAGFYSIYLNLKYKYDAVWVLMPQTAGVPASILNLFFPKIPIILTLQEGDPIDHIEKSVSPLWPLFARIFRHATVVQAISTYLGNWAKARGATCPINIIYNGANENDFKEEHDQETLEKIKKQINRQDGEVILVTTSRLVHKNAIDDVINSLQYLPANIRFIIAGAGEDVDKLKTQVKNLNLEKRVTFLGQVNRYETSILRKLGDIFVRPSRSEGLGNSFAGAMAAKIPVIATQEGGIAEFLFDSARNPNFPPTGFAVDKNSPKQIAEKVLYIINNKEFVKQVVDNAYNLVVEDYRWDNIAKKMEEKVFKFVLKL